MFLVARYFASERKHLEFLRNAHNFENGASAHLIFEGDSLLLSLHADVNVAEIELSLHECAFGFDYMPLAS